MSSNFKGRRLVTVVIGLILLSASCTSAPQRPSRELPPDEAFQCARPQPATSAVVPVYFQQDPPVLTPTYDGEVVFRNFTVAGDVDTVEFRRVPLETPEVWRNPLKTTIGGHAVSIFEPRWTTAQVAETVGQSLTGFDSPDIRWGDFLTPDGKRFGVYLRFASDLVAGADALASGASSPFDVHVEKVADGVYYSSDVVNLMMPEFGDSRITQEDPQVLQTDLVAKLFYQHFRDQYHVISILPQAVHLATFGGFQQTIKNEIEGIGIVVDDRTADFGSAGALQSVHFYPQNEGIENDATVHELAHQYGHYFDWQAIANIERGGESPGIHAPLWFADQALVGELLGGHWRIVPGSSASFELAVSPTVPHRFHPLTLYAMGLLAKSQVPPVDLISEQKQLDNRKDALEAGTPIRGSLVTRTIDDVVRQHDERSGPRIPAQVRWATVVVSREKHLSDAEWRYWTLFARRLGDPGASGQLDYRGYGSMEAAANRQFDVLTEILPKSGSPISQPLPVDDLSFGPRDFPGVELDYPIPTVFDRSLGKPLHLAGMITRTDRKDYEWVHVFLDLFPNDPAKTIDLAIEVVDQRFDREVPADEIPAGLYVVTIGLQTPTSHVNLGPSWSTFEVKN